MKKNILTRLFFFFILCTGMKKMSTPKNYMLIKQDLIATLEEINNNNEQFLSHYHSSEDHPEKFIEYMAMNAKRKNDLEYEEYTPLTLPAMIMLNTYLAKEYQQLTADQNNAETKQKEKQKEEEKQNEYLSKHLFYVEILEKLYQTVEKNP